MAKKSATVKAKAGRARTATRDLGKKAAQQQATVEDRYTAAVDSLAGAAKSARDWASPKVEKTLQSIAPKVEAGIAYAAPRIQDAVDRLGPLLDSAGHKVTEEYIPRLSDKVGATAAAAGTVLAKVSASEQLQQVAANLTGNKKSVKRAQKVLNKASRDLKTQKSSKGKWVWITLALSGLAAAVVTWRKSQPVEDPWSTPVNNRPADARPVGTSAAKAPAAQASANQAKSSDSSKDSASSKIDEVKDKARDIAGDVKEKAADAKEKVQDKTSKSADSTSEASGKETSAPAPKTGTPAHAAPRPAGTGAPVPGANTPKPMGTTPPIDPKK